MSVFFDVNLGRLSGVVRCVMVMSLSRVRVVRSGLMVAGFVVLCGFTMMPGSMFVMLCCLVVMLCGFPGHISSLTLPSS
jgi:hypothetical protein